MPGLAGDGFRAVAGGTGQQGVQVIGFEGNVTHPAGVRRLSFYPAQLHAAVQPKAGGGLLRALEAGNGHAENILKKGQCGVKIHNVNGNVVNGAKMIGHGILSL